MNGSKFIITALTCTLGVNAMSCKKKKEDTLPDVKIEIFERVKDSIYPCSFWFLETGFIAVATKGFDNYKWQLFVGMLSNGKDNSYTIFGNNRYSGKNDLSTGKVSCEVSKGSFAKKESISVNYKFHYDSSLVYRDLLIQKDTIIHRNADDKLSVKNIHLLTTELDSAMGIENLIIGSHAVYFELKALASSKKIQRCPIYVYTKNGLDYFLSIKYFSELSNSFIVKNHKLNLK
ncbi:MAG: hypothetical protein IT244_08470 [Bacteroidia bacterium]|nr:hypothetical protein [Bacteroidia bacterium]